MPKKNAPLFDGRFAHRRFVPGIGHRIGRPVVAVEYEHLGTKRGVWRHDFENKDVELWFMDDGSLLIRSASGRRLWDTFTVGDDE